MEGNQLNEGQRDAVFNRLVSGIITSVDEDTGLVSVRFEDFVGQRNDVELSFDYFSRVGPGWMRWMPSIGDRILGGFRMDDSFEMLRYAPVNYSQYTQFAADANPPFIFRKLKSGEFEIMSSGYAGIWGSKNGHLSISGGLATIDLDRDSTQITTNALLHYDISDTSFMRFGNIRRPSLTTPGDNEATTFGFPDKEYAVSLSKRIGLVTTKLYECTIGRVVDYTLGIFTNRLQTSTGQPLRADMRIYTVDGVQSIRFQADQLGNIRVDLPVTAVDGLRLVSAASKLIVENLATSISSTTTMEIEGRVDVTIKSNVHVSLDAPLVSLGGSAGNVLTNLTAISDFTGAFIQPGLPTVRAG